MSKKIISPAANYVPQYSILVSIVITELLIKVNETWKKNSQVK